MSKLYLEPSKVLALGLTIRDAVERLNRKIGDYIENRSFDNFIILQNSSEHVGPNSVAIMRSAITTRIKT